MKRRDNWKLLDLKQSERPKSKEKPSVNVSWLNRKPRDYVLKRKRPKGSESLLKRRLVERRRKKRESDRSRNA